jgi:hypothetical protein
MFDLQRRNSHAAQTETPLSRPCYRAAKSSPGTWLESEPRIMTKHDYPTAPHFRVLPDAVDVDALQAENARLRAENARFKRVQQIMNSYHASYSRLGTDPLVLMQRTFDAINEVMKGGGL